MEKHKDIIYPIRLAFYKGRGTLLDNIIRVFTFSKYSHVEIVIDNVWYSCSPRDGGTRKKIIKPKEENWDFIILDTQYKNVIKLKSFLDYEVQNNKGYDYIGAIFSAWLHLNKQQGDKWFCSELAAYGLSKYTKYKLSKPYSKYSPGKLFKKIVNLIK